MEGDRKISKSQNRTNKIAKTAETREISAKVTRKAPNYRFRGD